MAFTNLKEFYRSIEWRKFRETYLAERIARDGELIDDITGNPILKPYDAILHHVEHLTEQNVMDYSISLNPDNIQLVSYKTHNRLHEKFFKKKKVVVVFGSSRSGKSTFVDSVMGKDDIVICVDRLYTAISNTRSPKVLGTVMDMQRMLLDVVKTRKGNWATVYIITTSIFNTKRIRDTVDPDEIIHIDTDKQTCFERAKEKIKQYGEDYEKSFNRYWDEVENNQMLLDELKNF